MIYITLSKHTVKKVFTNPIIPLTANMNSRIKNTSHLLDIIDHLNEKGLPSNAKLISFDIVNMFPSIDNQRGMEAVKTALENRIKKEPSTVYNGRFRDMSVKQ